MPSVEVLYRGCLRYKDDLVIGFVSEFHYLHPDKSVPELWIDGLAVAPTHCNKDPGADGSIKPSCEENMQNDRGERVS